MRLSSKVGHSWSAAEEKIHKLEDERPGSKTKRSSPLQEVSYKLVIVVSQACSPCSAAERLPELPEHDTESESDEHEQLTERRRATIELP